MLNALKAPLAVIVALQTTISECQIMSLLDLQDYAYLMSECNLGIVASGVAVNQVSLGDVAISKRLP